MSLKFDENREKKFNQENRALILEPVFQKGISIHDIYEVYDENKTGGMGFIGLCRNKIDKNFYVLKTYQCDNNSNSFKEEIEFALKLEKHPHVVYSQTALKEKDRVYLVMELVGEEPNKGIVLGKDKDKNWLDDIKIVETDTRVDISLYDMSRKEPWKASTLETELQKGIKIKNCFKYAIEFCRGMQYLNSIGMKSHSDIKPSNIFIEKEIKTWVDKEYVDKEYKEKNKNVTELLKASHIKEYKYVKIADFGFATLKGKKDKKGCSEYYYSPEHFIEDKELDVRSDIYSFGVVLYEMFNAGTNLQTKTRIGMKLKRKNNFIEVSKIKSKHCDKIIKKCLQPKQKDRYQIFKDLEEDLLKEARREIDKDFEVEKLPIEKMEAKDYFDKGNGYQNIEQYEEAIKNYDRAIKIDRRYIYAYNSRGVAKQNLKQYEEAIKDFDKAIKLDKNYAYAYNNRGTLKNDLKQYKEAIEDYDKAIKLDKNYVSAYYNRGNAKYNLKEYKEAIEDYDKVIKLNKKYTKAYYNRGVVNENLKQYEQAIKDYDKAIELNPEFAEAYYNRGCLKYDLKQYQESIRDYDKAIQLDVKNYMLYYNRGLVKKELKQYVSAITDYDTVIKLKSDFSIAYHNRGTLKRELKQYKEAIKDYKKAIRINKHQIDTYYNLISLYNEMGKEKEAKEIEEKLKEITK